MNPTARQRLARVAAAVLAAASITTLFLAGTAAQAAPSATPADCARAQQALRQVDPQLARTNPQEFARQVRQAAQNVARVCAEAYRPTTTPRATTRSTTTTRTTPTTTSRTTTTTSRSTTTTTTPSTTTPTFPPVDGEVCFNSNPKGSGFLTYSTFCSYTATSVTVTSNLLFDRGGTPDNPAFATLQCPNPNANLYGTDEGSGYRNNDFTPTQAFREFNTFRVINTEGQTGRITIFVTCRTSENS